MINKLKGKMPTKPMAEEEVDQDLGMEELEMEADEEMELEDEELALEDEEMGGLFDEYSDEDFLSQVTAEFQNRGLSAADLGDLEGEMEDSEEFEDELESEEDELYA